MRISTTETKKNNGNSMKYDKKAGMTRYQLRGTMGRKQTPRYPNFYQAQSALHIGSGGP